MPHSTQTTWQIQQPNWYPYLTLPPPPQVVVAERDKEKERRKGARELKTQQSIAAQEERIQRSIRRSQEPVVKRTGKPVMFRSQPIVRKKKVEENVDKVDEEDDVRRAALQPTRTAARLCRGCATPPTCAHPCCTTHTPCLLAAHRSTFTFR